MSDNFVLLKDSEKENSWTKREILQQPEMLIETFRILQRESNRYEEFLRPWLDADNSRIILSGAGSSAFIGESISQWIDRTICPEVEAVSTTDIVATPRSFLKPQKPTLMISYGRSGNSPESLAAIALANKLVPNIAHLIITCNSNGELAALRDADRTCVAVLPEATHDRSFAMTSSFSCMTMATLCLLHQVADQEVKQIACSVSQALESYHSEILEIASQGYERVVYLGSGGLLGVAREGALKLLELTDGSVMTAFDTPLGFRHGPKTMLNENTLVIMLLSGDDYTRRYELDLLEELRKEKRAGRALAIAATTGISDSIEVSLSSDVNANNLLFPYVAIAQRIALATSIHLGLDPDHPNASGTVNRVVQGVRIFDLGDS